MVAKLVPSPSSSLLGDLDLHLFNEGTHARLYQKLGAHPAVFGGVAGVHFAVWAPNARTVSVIGDWNGWTAGKDVLMPRGSSGIHEGFVPGVEKGAVYKYDVRAPSGFGVEKADPFAFCAEVPPKSASVVWSDDYRWSDRAWMKSRGPRQKLGAPISIYEVHLGSWRRVPEEGHRYLTYRELAPLLVDHVKAHGFTHVELLPVMEHPFYGSWGYQTTGYFAPTRRYGDPDGLKYLIDLLHQNEIGVILDWVPSHFPHDQHGLGYFDGTHLYEHSDPRQGHHPDWQSAIFNYGRHEVRSFLLSSAIYWLDVFHVDGLRVDAVASMLYLDYSRKDGEWIPNEYGGRENIPAIEFMRSLNREIFARFPDVQTYAEESTAWPMVSRPTEVGGLGFGLKWDMGWMHDTLKYMQLDPVHRKYHQDWLSFRCLYAHHENFVLPLSHDEVVHGKGSLLGKMSGDDWQRFANLRTLYAYQFALPGKKLLFMGSELAQWREWNHEESLDWHLLKSPLHAGVSRCVADLNRLYRKEPGLHVLDAEPAGFQWVDCSDTLHSVVGFLRKGRTPGDEILVVLNLTPVPRHGYRMGVPHGGFWREIFNSDSSLYGGSGLGNLGGAEAEDVPMHGFERSLELTLPPLGAVFLKRADWAFGLREKPGFVIGRVACRSRGLGAAFWIWRESSWPEVHGGSEARSFGNVCLFGPTRSSSPCTCFAFVASTFSRTRAVGRRSSTRPGTMTGLGSRSASSGSPGGPPRVSPCRCRSPLAAAPIPRASSPAPPRPRWWARGSPPRSTRLGVTRRIV